VRNQPDAAGFDALQAQGEPRRGTMRLSPSGGPQQPPAAPPQQPQMQGPQQPAEPVGAQLMREEVTNLLLAMRQGVTSSALLSAEPVTDPEIERVLNRPDDGDPDTEAGRLAVARERAAELGLDVVFRAGRGGRIEAVARTPEMQAAGGQLGQIADGIGRLLGVGFVDPIGGAAMAGQAASTRLGQRAATVGSLVMSSGGAGPGRGKRAAVAPYRIPAPEVPPRFKVEPRPGQTFDEWLDRIYSPEARGPDNLTRFASVMYRGVSDGEVRAAAAAGAFRPASGPALFVENDPTRYVGGGAYGARRAGWILQFDVAALDAVPVPSLNVRGLIENGITEIPLDRIARAWRWDAERKAHVLLTDEELRAALTAMAGGDQ
jgi:hypothetical protein